MPPRILIKVDLPAPFSPSSATTSPRLTSKLTPFSACVPPKDLATFSKRRMPASAKSLLPCLRRLSRLGEVPPRPIVKRVGNRHARVGALANLYRLAIGMIAPDKVAPAGRQLIKRQRCAKAELRRDLGRCLAGTRRRFPWRSLGRLRRRGPVCGLVH